MSGSSGYGLPDPKPALGRTVGKGPQSSSPLTSPADGALQRGEGQPLPSGLVAMPTSPPPPAPGQAQSPLLPPGSPLWSCV